MGAKQVSRLFQQPAHMYILLNSMHSTAQLSCHAMAMGALCNLCLSCFESTFLPSTRELAVRRREASCAASSSHPVLAPFRVLL
jgi:hypothetical protein